jgi:hypothetical protein
MSSMNDKGLGKRARRQVSERLRAYHESVLRMIEPDTEAFFERVMQRARSEAAPEMAQPQGHAQF